MNSTFWKIASEDQIRSHMRDLDGRFQAAMRQELRDLAADKGLRLLAKPTPKRAKTPRDIIAIPPSPTSMPMPPTPAQTIMREVCTKHGLTKEELVGPRRAIPLVKARHEAAYRMSKETTLSLPAIGMRLGGRDHTTIIYGIRKHEASMRGEVYRHPARARQEAAGL